jgi:hypothetical protein
MRALLVVMFSLVRHVEKSVVTQQHSQVTKHLSGSKHIAVIFHLKDWPSRQCVIGESSATSSSSGPSKYGTVVQSIYVRRHTTF